MREDSRSSIVSVPNVTPMIDVMLVLLIIFMVVTPTLLNGVHAEPPVAENLRPHPPEEGDHTLAIDAHGSLFLDKSSITHDGLGSALTALYPEGTLNRVLYIRAHKALPYGDVGAAIEVARTSGIATVALVTEQKRTP